MSSAKRPTDAELERELLALVRSKGSGRAQQAKVSALRTALRRRELARARSERAARERRREKSGDRSEEAVWPSTTPDALVTPGFWPHDGTYPASYSQVWEDVDSHETQGARDAARQRLEGPPPWRVRPEQPDVEGAAVQDADEETATPGGAQVAADVVPLRRRTVKSQR